MATLVDRRSPNNHFSVVVPSPARTTRSKRRRDEDIEDTIVLRTEPEEPLNKDSNPRTPKKARRTKNSRLPLSPQKVNTLAFKASKAVSEQPKKSEECPKTPRHRDSPAKKPVTPRHRVSIISKPLTPRNKLLATPTASTPTVHTAAKSLFSRSASSTRIVGRDEERVKLNTFVQDRISSRKGGCLYISGPPGCGKSALLTEVMESIVSEESGPTIKKASVNCMSLQDPKAIYSKIADEFLEESMRTGSSDLEDLENVFISNSTSDIYILVLDEIDHLLTNSQDLIHTIFELALRPRSRLVLMGIANALDLTDRFLPRLKARNLVPELLPFLPYTGPQIANVITARLRSLLSETEKESVDDSFIPFMHPAAIQLLSKKVAAASGDLRKAFDICRRAVELVELETRQQQAKSVDTENENPFAKPTTMVPSPPRKALAENPDLNSPSRITSAAYTALNAPKATLSHVARASSSSLGVSVSSRITKLNNHQRALLCALVSKSGTTPMDIRKLRESYGRLADQEGTLGVVKLAAGEFREVVESLEVAGVVDVVRRVGTPRKKGMGQGEESVVSRIGRMDLVTAIGSGPGSEGLGRILAQGL